MNSKWLTLMLASVIFAGCQTTDPYTGEDKTSRATTGAVVGAVAGAVVGAATSSKKDRKKGALIGATAGGAIGGGVGHYMDRQEAELRQKLEGTGVKVVRSGNEITLIMPGNITFDTGRAELKSQFFSTLDSVSLVLKEFDNTLIEVAGHTDSTGNLDFNQRLSEDRASSVGQFLITQGVASPRVQMVGFGPRFPVATNDTKEGRSSNRRVELKLLPMEG